MKKVIASITAIWLLCSLISCEEKISVSSHEQMISTLGQIAYETNVIQNSFSTDAKISFYTAMLKTAKSNNDSFNASFNLARTYLEQGSEQKSIPTLEKLLEENTPNSKLNKSTIKKELAIGWLRVGERTNCISNHGAQSCIFPIQGNGLHKDKTGSEKAIEIYKELLKDDPGDIESRWLLNIAYMTLDGYPHKVPKEHLIKGLGSDTSSLVKPFTDIAINTGLNTNNMAGGSIVEDFNNDGYLDLVTSSWGLKEGMHYCRNNGSGTFSDISGPSGLQQLTGGLNIMQTDYNNDGLKDIFVLRGAWKADFGKEPNSLLKNNGDGTFTDVTVESGLFSLHPTQTATWADFNNDGWLDVFIGNETSKYSGPHACEMFINNKNGTFTEVAQLSGVRMTRFIKGVTSGDYNNDGLVDIFVSTLDGVKLLLKNQGIKDGIPVFKNVAPEAGIAHNNVATFGTWFWDYDNDGWLDIVACGYKFRATLGCYTAWEALGQLPKTNSGEVFLFRNKQDGTFEDVSVSSGLNRIAFAMGNNFGDIDNDGYLDIYLGTGNPDYTSLVPNKMFKNIGGKKFIDVTSSARVGSLQKGHGVTFADLDNDGDQDIYIEMGGAFIGDAYQNSLFINPGQTNNNWIDLSLEGTKANRAAIGARLKITFKENGIERSVYRDVNSGGSFGSNPLKQHIGIGQATAVDKIEIKWPGSKTFQVFENLAINQSIQIKEGSPRFKKLELKKLAFASTGTVGCAPI